MFGWMLIKVVLFATSAPLPKIVVPTTLIPLTMVGVALSATASFLSGLFGLRLKWEGPKRLLEALLQPRVLLSLLAVNLLFLGGYQSYVYIRELPKPSWYIAWKNHENPYLGERLYTDSPQTLNTIRLPTHLRPFPKGLSLLWEKQLSAGAFGEITLSGPSLFVGSKDGFVYELDRHSGEELRRFYVGTFVSPTPIVWNRRLFVGEGQHTTHHARIYAFDLNDGHLIDSFSTRGHTEGVPVLASYERQTLLFVTAGRDGLYAVDPNTLEAVWQQKVGHVDSEVRVVNGRVYFSTGLEKDDPKERPQAVALDFASGRVIWKRELAASGWRAPVTLADRVCFSLGEVFFPSHFGQLACFDPENGQPLTAVNFAEPLIGIPRLVHNTVIVSDLTGRVCAVDPMVGQRLWCQALGQIAKTYASANADERGLILYPSTTQGVVALKAESGEKLLRWYPSEGENLAWTQVMSSVRSDGQNLFVVDWNGVLRKLRYVE